MENHRLAACRPCGARGSAAFAAHAVLISAFAAVSGCTNLGGYSTQTLFPEDIATVRLEMFDNRSFRRGLEYDLSDALAKRIESNSPYKIVSDPDRADSVMSGQLVSIGESVLTVDRSTALPLEKEVVVTAVVNWKDLKTGRIMINNQTVTATATYSEFQSQDYTYASTLAANRLAGRIVELMEQRW